MSVKVRNKLCSSEISSFCYEVKVCYPSRKVNERGSPKPDLVKEILKPGWIRAVQLRMSRDLSPEEVDGLLLVVFDYSGSSHAFCLYVSEEKRDEDLENCMQVGSTEKCLEFTCQLFKKLKKTAYKRHSKTVPNHQGTVKKASIFAPIKLRFLKLRDLYKKGHISHQF